MIDIDLATKRFPDGTLALDNVSLAVPRGATFGINLGRLPRSTQGFE